MNKFDHNFRNLQLICGYLILCVIFVWPIRTMANDWSGKPYAQYYMLLDGQGVSPHGTYVASWGNGHSKKDKHNRSLVVTTTDTKGGGGWDFKGRQKRNIDRFVSDPASYVEWICRWRPTESPGAIRVGFRTKQGLITTPYIAASKGKEIDGWYHFRAPLSTLQPKQTTIQIQGVLFFTQKPTTLSIRNVDLVRYRNMTAKVLNAPKDHLEQLVLQGRIDSLTDKVELVIESPDGKVHRKLIKAKDGVFKYVWKKPPLAHDKISKLYARLSASYAVMDRSMAVDVFGYTPNNEHLWLSVEGKHVVTSPSAKGGSKPFISAGISVSTHRDVGTHEGKCKYIKDHHLNTLRLTIYTRYLENKQERPVDIQQHIIDWIDPVVKAARRNQLYVILDAHEFFHGSIIEEQSRQKQTKGRWNERALQEWISAWVAIAKYYKDDPYILGYELLNEPHNIPSKTVRSWYIRCIKAIREVDKRHIILLGTSNWTHARALEKTWGPVATNVDAPYNNVVFAFHDYPEDNHPWIVQRYVTKFRDKYNVPLMCTEYGATSWAHGETVCRQFEAGMLTLCAKEDIGWMLWCMVTLEDNPRNCYNKIDHRGRDRNDFAMDNSYSDLWAPAARIMASSFPKKPEP